MHVVEVLEKGMADGTQIGAQIYVSRDGSPIVDIALGDARPGVPMATDSLMVWFSMTKAVTSVAVAQQWERGALDPDDLVVRFVPEFGAEGKDVITLRQLLTHTAGIPNADEILQGRPWRESRGDNLARIYTARIEPGWVPGARAGYHAAAGMSVLGEIVARTSGRPFDEYVREEIFEPLGMHDSWVGMPEDRYEAYGERIGVMHDTTGSEAVALRGIDSPRATASPMPGANGRGPVRELGRFYEMLLGRGTFDGVQLLTPQTVAAISARHRVGMVDETFGIVSDWGLGFAIDTYITGRHSSTRAFGHGGHQSSAAFCDPEHGVVLAVVCNGMPGPELHHPRMDAIATAAYVDAGIASVSDPGRAKPYPTTSL